MINREILRQNIADVLASPMSRKIMHVAFYESNFEQIADLVLLSIEMSGYEVVPEGFRSMETKGSVTSIPTEAHIRQEDTASGAPRGR